MKRTDPIRIPFLGICRPCHGRKILEKPLPLLKQAPGSTIRQASQIVLVHVKVDNALGIHHRATEGE